MANQLAMAINLSFIKLTIIVLWPPNLAGGMVATLPYNRFGGTIAVQHIIAK